MCPFKKALPFAIFLHLMLVGGIVGAYAGGQKEEPAFVFTMVAAQGQGEKLAAGEPLCPLRPEVISAEVKKWETSLRDMAKAWAKDKSPKLKEMESEPNFEEQSQAPQGSVAAATQSPKTFTGGAAAVEKQGDKLTPPMALYQPKPKHFGKKGEVSVTFTITTQGTVENVELEQGTDIALVETVEQCVKTWKFAPAKKQGAAIPIRVRQVVVF